VRVTAEGREYARSDILAAKEMFARLVRERVPLVKTICTALAAVPDGKLRRNFFVDLLRRSFSEEEANVQLDIPSAGAVTANCSNTTRTHAN